MAHSITYGPTRAVVNIARCGKDRNLDTPTDRKRSLHIDIVYNYISPQHILKSQNAKKDKTHKNQISFFTKIFGIDKGYTYISNKISYMKNETFYQAKKLNDQIDGLTVYLNKLYHAKGKGNIKEVKITYHAGKYNTKCEVFLPIEASDFIEEMLLKEICRVVEKRDKLQDEFNNI